MLKQHGIRVSMGGKGRRMGNVFAERRWRNVKYEAFDDQLFKTMKALRDNQKRRLNSLVSETVTVTSDTEIEIA